jgi:nucleoside-diphosphate-sugar epimerase
MSIVLISGASGFVGRNLSAWLAGQGHQVWALDRTAQPLSAVISAAYTWDELAAIDWARISAVIHLAGKAHDTRHTTDPQTYFEINLGLTEKLFDHFRASPARTFIQFSSVKAVADRVPAGSELTEDATPCPCTPYGQSKLAAEQYLQAAPLDAARRLYILRPCMIHGPGNKGNLNLLYAFARRGLPYPLAAFDNRRSFTGIENLCQAVAGLLRLRGREGRWTGSTWHSCSRQWLRRDLPTSHRRCGWQCTGQRKLARAVEELSQGQLVSLGCQL